MCSLLGLGENLSATKREVLFAVFHIIPLFLESSRCALWEAFLQNMFGFPRVCRIFASHKRLCPLLGVRQTGMKKKILFIVNPISGTGDKLGHYKTIRQLIDRDRFEFSVCHTKYAGHAEEMARQAVGERFDIVVAVGGDGTVNEVARSVVHSSTALGIIPCGSGNGLARHLDIPLSVSGAMRVINQAVVHCLDYGKIDGRPFFCTCGMGFDAFISKEFADAGTRGLRTYVEKALVEGLKYQPQTYSIENEDGTLHYEAYLIACANASQYGNNAFIAPQASMKDGLLDVIVMEPFNKIMAPQVAMQMFTKSLPRNSHIKAFTSRKLRITRPEEGPIHCDGDPFMAGKEIEVEIVPACFNVVVNPAARGRNRNFWQLASQDVVHWWQTRQDEIVRGGKVVRKLFR